MADRFPLAVNYSSRKIEEFISGDNLDLTGNGISINGDIGVSGQYLKSTGSGLQWDSPGNVYLTQVQTLTNKTLQDCTFNAALNSISNIPNSSLTNSGIIVNGISIPLGGTVNTPDNNTTYSISAIDGASAAQKIFRLTAGGSGSGTDDIILAVGTPTSTPAGSNALSLFLSRTDDTVTISGHVVDNNTVTTLVAPGGTATSGAINFTASNAASVSMTGSTINIDATNTDTKTKIRVGSGGTYGPSDNSTGNFTFLQAGATTITQAANGTTGDPEITISSQDTITSIKGGGTGTFVSGQVTISGGTNVTVSQAANTITISSTDTNTITRLAANAGGTLAAGSFRFTSTGATTITTDTESEAGVTIFEISSANTDTTYSEGIGISLSGTSFALKNNNNLSDNKILKWDAGNGQLVNSSITDDGTTVTIGGNLTVTGTTTTINTTNLSVADNIIELRRGNSITGTDSGIQVNRTTNASGTVLTFNQLRWYEVGGYWETYDGSISRRLVTENETQTLTNKTLTSPILTNPALGIASATSINGLTITATTDSTLTVLNLKTVTFSNTMAFSATDGAAVNFGGGGGAGATVAYTSNTLAAFATTTSTQLRGVVSDSTGSGVLVFSTSPQFTSSVTTNSTTFNAFNTTATIVSTFGAATTLSIGAATGTTTINNSLVVGNDFTANNDSAELFTVNGIPNFENNDIIIRGGGSAPLKIGTGGSNVSTNTRMGYNCLENNTTGSQNTAIGYESLLTNLEGAANTTLGYRTLRANTTGFNNVAVGKDAGLLNQGGDNNVAIGTGALGSNVGGNNNVCIGHFAGYGLTGSGNVLIGAAGDEDSTNATYFPPSATGNNQLVIGSGTEAWIYGDGTYAVTIPNNFRVNGNTIVDGNLTVNGTTTTINSNTISIDDKNIELASVVNIVITANVVNNSTSITGITPTTGLIPGMTVTSLSGGISVPEGTYIVSLNNNTAVLSNPVSGSSGSATFEAAGPTDLGADGGGLILKGATNKTILYDHSRTDKYWVFSENLELATGKQFTIGNQLILSTTTLGATVVNSSLTSVGELGSLTVNGFVKIGGVVTEKALNNFDTSLAPASNTLTINVGASNTILGKPTTQSINTWAFTGVGLSSGQSKTITLILESNTAAIYGDACTVDGNTVSNGIRWSGGSPPVPTNNTDILTFVIVRDNAGVTRVFGQGNTDFS